MIRQNKKSKRHDHFDDHFKFHFPWIVVVFIFLCSSCKDESMIPDTSSQVDYRLIGVWIKIPSEFELHHPHYPIEGIHISPSAIVHRLAVETATGKFVFDNDQVMDSLWAQNGTFFRKRFCPPSTCSDSGSYFLSGDTLRLIYKNTREEKYTLTQIGKVVTEPIQTDLTTMIDSIHLTNDKIAPAPSAKAIIYSIVQDFTSFEIVAFLNNTTYSNFTYLHIRIPHFNTPQSYPIGGNSQNSGSLTYLSGDVLSTFRTDSIHTGTITITSFDLSKMRCSGTFEFEAVKYDIPPRKFVKSVRNGVFNIPITFPIRAKAH